MAENVPKKEDAEKLQEDLKEVIDVVEIKPGESMSLVEKARKEERQKLYSKIKKLTDQILLRDEELKANRQRIADLQRKIQNAKQNLDTSEKVTELEKSLVAEKLARKQAEAKLKDLESKYEVDMYRLSKLQGVADIIPELVTGQSKEEIDKNFEVAKQRYQEILAKARETATVTTQKKMKEIASATHEKGVKAEGQQLTEEDIRNMTLEEYKKYRSQLLDSVGV